MVLGPATASPTTKIKKRVGPEIMQAKRQPLKREIGVGLPGLGLAKR